MISNHFSPLPDTEVHYLRSEHAGDEFKILIGHCGSAEPDPPLVVFLGDPWASFGTAVEVIRLLRLTAVVPPLLVVGVGYRTTDMDEIEVLRTRDFTPTIDSSDELAGRAAMGGASSFLAFIRDELKPWLREGYGVDPDDSMFFGDSFGGLFATYVLLSEPATFRRYGIGSPSLYWDKGVMFEREAEYAKAHDDLLAKVFFSVGDRENPAGARRRLQRLPIEERARAEARLEDRPTNDLVAYTERMVAALRSRTYPSLEIEYELLPGEYHETSPPLNLSRSLRYLFDAPR